MNPSEFRKVLNESGPTSSAHALDYVRHVGHLRAVGHAAADAWEVEQEDDIRKQVEHELEYNRLLDDNAALRTQLAEIKERLSWAIEHPPGCRCINCYIDNGE